MAWANFTQPDEWQGEDDLPVTLNKYQYAEANPVRYVDPSGHWSIAGLATRTGTLLRTVGRLGVKQLGKRAVSVRRFLVRNTTRIHRVIDSGELVLRTTASRISFRGPPNTLIRGTIDKTSGLRRAFVTDSRGRIVKEITRGRVKIRRFNRVGDKRFDFFEKVGKPTARELKVLEKVQ